jgi:hypothetical protein
MARWPVRALGINARSWMALLAIEAYPTATLRCDPWHSSWRRFGVVQTMNTKQLD